MANFRLTVGERVFRGANYVFLTLFGLFTFYPFWYVLQGSFSDPAFSMNFIWPRGDLYYANYQQVFAATGIGNAYLVSVARVIVAVPLTILVTGAAAFALTRKELWGRKAIILLFFITMFFNGGIIPLFLVLRSVGLIDRFLVFVLPVVFNVWMMIVMKTSFQQLPEGLVEAAVIDGATYLRIFFQVLLPLSLPMVATLALFNAVWHWNDWFFGAFYIIDPSRRPLQTFLREAVLEGGIAQRLAAVWFAGSGNADVGYSDSIMRQLGRITPESLKLAFIVVTTIPIMAVYPFIQRYFMKGVLIGSIKE